MNTELKTSREWQQLDNSGIKILDPDGWNRANFDYSFNKELITEQQYNRRKSRSTCAGRPLKTKKLIMEEEKQRRFNLTAIQARAINIKVDEMSVFLESIYKHIEKQAWCGQTEIVRLVTESQDEITTSLRANGYRVFQRGPNRDEVVISWADE